MKRFGFTVFTSTLIGLVGCGGGDNDLGFFDRDDTEVRDMSFEDDDVNAGEASVLRVYFDYDNIDVETGDDVFVSVLLPKGLAFRTDSAEIDGGGSGDKGVTPRLISCSQSGETYLIFKLDRGDLNNAQSSGSSDAQLSMTAHQV